MTKLQAESWILLVLCGMTVAVGVAELTITVTNDEGPEDVAWTFTNQNTNVELFPGDSGSWTDNDDNDTTSSETFYNLESGSYLFELQGLGMNGSNWRTGMITFSNETHILYELDGNFTETIQISVGVNSEGEIFSIYQLLPHPDPDWPGYMNEATENSFTINAKFDDNSLGADILLLKKDETYYNTGWLEMYEYTGTETDNNTLWSATFENFDFGIYFLRLTSPGTGIRWATLTNHTHVFWYVEGEEFVDNQTEYYFAIEPLYGKTMPWVWNGMPPPEDS